MTKTTHEYLSDIEAWETAYSRAEEEIEAELGWTEQANCVGITDPDAGQHEDFCDYHRELARVADNNRFGGYL